MLAKIAAHRVTAVHWEVERLLAVVLSILCSMCQLGMRSRTSPCDMPDILHRIDPMTWSTNREQSLNRLNTGT